MRDELIKKITHETIFLKYQINESFDKPFSNIRKKNEWEYHVNEDGVLADFIFTYKPNNNDLDPIYFYTEKIDMYYGVFWKWGKGMNKDLKTANNWMRMTSTALKIIDDFIRTIKPLVIKFSNNTPDNWKIYRNTHFIDKLETIFGEKFDVLVNEKMAQIFLINKNVSKFKTDSIEKLTESGCATFDEAWNLWKFPKKRNQKGITRNNTIKEQRKRILYKMKYLF